MSTSPDARADDRLITLISRWLGRHIGNAELRRGIEETGSDGLGPGSLDALGELLERLDSAQPGERGELEMIARETLEALALGE
jgi:hypothetical protein